MIKIENFCWQLQAHPDRLETEEIQIQQTEEQQERLLQEQRRKTEHFNDQHKRYGQEEQLALDDSPSKEALAGEGPQAEESTPAQETPPEGQLTCHNLPVYCKNSHACKFVQLEGVSRAWTSNYN